MNSNRLSSRQTEVEPRARRSDESRTRRPEPVARAADDGRRKLEDELLSLYQRRRAKFDEYVELLRDAESSEDHLHAEIAILDRRIARLREALSQAAPVSSADRESGTVGVGSHVVVRWEGEEGEERYVVVGPHEADLASGRISYESPVGRALVGRRQGEQVEVATPDGARGLAVLAVK